MAGKEALRPATRAEYTRHIQIIFIPRLGGLRLINLRAHHIEDLFRDLARTPPGHRPVRPQTLRRILATLHSALATAVKRGLIRRNPASTVELARPLRYQAAVWTADQARTFLRDATSDELYPAYRMLLLTGMRRGEAIGLRWSDFHLDEATVTITRTITTISGQPTIGVPKSDSGIRTVHLDPETIDMLRARYRITVLASDPGTDIATSYVFHRDGTFLSPAYVSRHFTTLTKQLRLPQIRLHDLRHTSASLGLAHGEPLLQVSRRLGHSGIGITADVYAHVTTEAATTAAAALAEQLSTPTERKNA
ncbi:site-specific integrase [Allobranchiibius sp. GilTou38]|uniref:tyrosine-type recombinase/integrase n=1 Tax=Allobranchiibius sp. GilTou38 TaxID=2815210 RepID=UPI001AA14E21|nr:site-specific integrase [Allobranchiibius sp. GilTou38]MBO1765791.1 site-specific integrase [Allobranchiibius sp. GilTou38]